MDFELILTIRYYAKMWRINLNYITEYDTMYP